jgi:hypothetical protein
MTAEERQRFEDIRAGAIRSGTYTNIHSQDVLFLCSLIEEKEQNADEIIPGQQRAGVDAED